MTAHDFPRGEGRWAAVADYASSGQGGELHARINPGMVSATSGLAPNGFNLNQICTYGNALGDNVIVPPAPTPTHVNPPTPGPTPTSVNVPFAVYNLTVSGVLVSPARPTIIVPDPVTVPLTVGNQQISLTIAAALASKWFPNHYRADPPGGPVRNNS